MARKPKGKALTLRPIRLDDDVWAECQRLGKEHGTINEGLRAGFFPIRPTLNMPPPTQTMLDDTEIFRATIKSEVDNHLKQSRFKGPLLKPKDNKK